ncbi:Asp23/Gls24 family envelope stress response protein [Brevibacillus fulvus]|uniref:Alkaline shock family protein YloU n=1 Tax=Brevibacillus fulvus TaxID=1125967 RepID=A0A938XUW8_9BACL|nr:Asp23/Gls24 family envelope stress response protein [Brevibacillus fulvus]MBM7588534.1 putative alkaline shock family protein YloU [Brevibacillus fulvus]
MGEWARGKVNIADHVIAVIAAKAAKEIEGITMRSSGLYQDLTKRVQGGGYAKGVNVKITEGKISLLFTISVPYGTVIHDLCRLLQQTVKHQVEELTGLLVEAVDVRVEALTS